MSRSGYEIFKTKAFTLAKTIIVKHEESAEIMNNYLRNVEGYYVDLQNRWTWRYYMNLAGEYHEADHRELADINGNGVGMMTIRIADTDGSREVYFTKELLHGPTADYALANEYTYDSRAYKDLLERYPNFESLILGILYPIDIDTAVLSPNHSVLYCGDYFAKPYNSNYDDLIYELSSTVISDTTILIESQEVNLIPEIQEYIRNTIFRWNTSEYIETDNLYWATFLGNLYAYLPMKILNIRLGNCLTERAHTFHITEYLESNGQLGRHVQNLPLKQSLFLYRNIRHYNNNYGKESTFQAMIDNMLTPMNVPLAGYDAVHDIVAMPDELYPTPYMLRDPINLTQLGSERDLRTIESVMTKEIPLAKSNGRDLDLRIAETTSTLEQTRYNELRSKVLESTMLDYTNTERYTLPDILFNMWVWSATHDRYRGTIYVTHPYSGERIQLTPLNGLTLFFYCVQRGVFEIPAEYPPIAMPRWIPKLATDPDYPTLESLQKMTVKKYVSDAELKSLMSNHTPLLNYGSTRLFHESGTAIWDELMRRQQILYRTEDFNARSMLEACMRNFYRFDIDCHMLADGLSYDDWLRSLGIDFTHLSKDDLITLAMSIYIKATGQDVNTRASVADMQQSLLDIMKHFSSYTVQYLKGITFGSPINTDGKLLRLSDKPYNRGFAGKLGGGLELPKLNGALLYYPRFGGWVPLQNRDPNNDVFVENSGWITRFGGDIGMSGINHMHLMSLRVKSALPIPNLNATKFNLSEITDNSDVI